MGCTVSVQHQTFYAKDLYNGYRYYATVDNEYFDEGCFRYAFKGTLHGKGPENNKPCVVKVYKNASSATMSDMREDLKASALAKDFADEFMRTCSPALKYLGLNVQIVFVQPFLATIKRPACVKTCGLCVQDTDDRYFKLNQYVFIEPYITGDYEKFNSNWGYEDVEHPVMTAFCHWTWHKSEGKYMVCDLQGVNAEGKYILTDPAIHSTDAEHHFGNTDCRDKGMVMVLNNHKCNRVCHQLGLTNPYTRYRHLFSFEGYKTQSTLYNFQVSKIDFIYAQQIIAMRKPIPDPMIIVFLPVIVEEEHSGTLEHVIEAQSKKVEKKQRNLDAPRLNAAKAQLSNSVQRAVLPVVTHKLPMQNTQRIKDTLPKPNRNAANTVFVGGPICNDWPLPCNFYCNHCLRGAAMVKDNRWTFS